MYASTEDRSSFHFRDELIPVLLSDRSAMPMACHHAQRAARLVPDGSETRPGCVAVRGGGHHPPALVGEADALTAGSLGRRGGSPTGSGRTFCMGAGLEVDNGRSRGSAVIAPCRVACCRHPPAARARFLKRGGGGGVVDSVEAW